MFEGLRAMQERLAKLGAKMDDVKGELKAIRTYIFAEHHDIGDIYAMLAKSHVRLERIERRLELREPEPA